MTESQQALAQRRDQLLRRAALQRHELRACVSGLTRQTRAGPLAMFAGFWASHRLWLRPVLALAAPLLAVSLLRKPAMAARVARWVVPAWQAARAVQHWKRG